MSNLGRPLRKLTITALSAAVIVFLFLGAPGDGVGQPEAVDHPFATSPMTMPAQAAGPSAMVASPPGPGELAAASLQAATVVEERTAPQTFGDDAELDTLWVDCDGGHGAACDLLFEWAPVGSGYEEFGLSCGQRVGVLNCAEELDAVPTEG